LPLLPIAVHRCRQTEATERSIGHVDPPASQTVEQINRRGLALNGDGLGVIIL